MEQFDSSLIEPEDDADEEKILEDFEDDLLKTSPGKLEPVYSNPIEWQVK
jgi:hypothetical protein